MAINLAARRDIADVHSTGISVDCKHDPPVAHPRRSPPGQTRQWLCVRAERISSDLFEAAEDTLVRATW